MDKFNSAKERFVYFLENHGSNRNKFYVQSGVSNGALDKKTGLTEATILKIFEIYPEISLDWLLLGKGEMLRQNTPAAAVESPSVVAYLEKNVTDLRNELAQAYQTIGQLQQQLADLKEKAASASARTKEAAI